MKKLFSILMIAVVLSSAFLFNVGRASAASITTLVDVRFVNGKGIAFVFDANGMKVRAPNLKNSMLYLHGNAYPLACRVNKHDDMIVCTARGGLTEFAGDQGSVSLLGRLYSVIIPARGIQKALSCASGYEPGAMVTFFTSDETTVTIFIPGDTLAEVEANANSLLGNYFLQIVDIGPLVCGQILG